ncbi:hypothetical protein ACFW9O_25105 [Streptomyces sp. NPDC059499]|uniref:hypothetical protein n=1 Tax=Streptomyces sp. NPDC059499 TaxID=3346852 RepID=UPI0036B5985D
MISARLRYIVLGLAAVTWLTLACAYIARGLIWPHGIGSLLLAAFGFEGAAYVRRAADRLQDLHHQAMHRALAEAAAGITEPWSTWCCERGFLTRGDLHHPANCTKEQQT